jgi:O-antigen/teichoic acid export membrane protein
LGASDYGLYNVVGGIVTLFMFVNVTLSTGTLRFLTFALGQGDTQKLRHIFSTVSYLHFFLMIIILIISEVVGLWLLYNKMQIPEGRMDAAFWVLQFSVFASLVAVIQVPFMSSIMAHEKMNIYAWVSIYDAVMKLLIVFLIQVVNSDKLILYAFLLLLVHVSTSLIYIYYCRIKYEECRLFKGFDKKIFKDIASFSGWNVFGVCAVTMQAQGVNILLNMFFGTIVNAARGIAVQVNGIIIQFVGNFQAAVNPQIVKLYASGQKDKMISLVIENSKIAAYLLLLIAVPLFIELEFVLKLWLGEYPYYTPIFLRIIIVQSLIQTISRPLVMAVHAVGKMKEVSLTSGLGLLLILPITYLLLKLGVDIVIVFIVNVIPWLLETLFDLYYENKFIGFPVWGFYRRVYGIVFPLAIIVFMIPYVVHIFLPFQGWGRFMIVCFVSVVTSVIVIYYLGLSKYLRGVVLDKVNSFIKTRLKRS